MAVNVLDRIEQLFNEAATQSTAEAIGASPEAVSAAVRPALATVIKAVVSRSETSDGAEYLLRTVSEFEGAVHGNFTQIVDSGMYEDVSAVGKRVASELFGDTESDCVEQVGSLAGLTNEQASSLLHSVTGLVFDLAGEERSKKSQNRLGVTKFFEAQRTLLRAEIATHILESVGLIEADFETDSCDLTKFRPNEDVSFVPPLQSSDTVDADEIIAPTAKPNTSGRNGQETTESLGLGEVTLEEDEPERLREQVADALSDPGRVFTEEEIDALGGEEELPKGFSEEEEVVLTDTETKAFYVKSLLALATLATLWFTLLNFRSNRDEPSKEATKTAQRSTTTNTHLVSETTTPASQTDDGVHDASITKVSANSRTSLSSFIETAEPVNLFAVDATPTKIETATDITPGTAIARQSQEAFDQIEYDLATHRHHSPTSEPTSFASSGGAYKNSSELVNAAITTDTSDSLSGDSGMIENDSPHVDLARYAARPAEVRIEPVGISQQTPGLIAYKIVDSLRIPVFQQPRSSGKSYYTP